MILRSEIFVIAPLLKKNWSSYFFQNGFWAGKSVELWFSISASLFRAKNILSLYFRFIAATNWVLFYKNGWNQPF